MEKKFKNGLVLGKFFPFTLGHKHLIDSALSQCETVNVIVCSLPTESIPGHIRYLWVRNTYIENVHVKEHWCNDVLPQKPEECESVDVFYNKYWVPKVHFFVKDLDVVFTSEEYGEEFARYLNIQHVLVDLNRETVPISGTLVRSNPLKYWDYLPTEVKPYFVKKIVVMGPESTGKSTLVKTLSSYYNCQYVEEYGRTFDEEIKSASEWNVNDYETVALIHEKNIKNSRLTNQKMVIIDTEAITTKLFGEMYLENFESEIIDYIIEKQKFDLVLLLTPDVPWVDDGTRDFPHRREEHFNRIREELDLRGINYILIDDKTYRDRLIKSIDSIDSLILNY